jgi:hypothetical protein
MALNAESASVAVTLLQHKSREESVGGSGAGTSAEVDEVWTVAVVEMEFTVYELLGTSG